MQYKQHQTNLQQGFTLIELLIVIAIIGLLATIAILSLTSAQAKARDTKRIADVNEMRSAATLFYTDNGWYPLAVNVQSGSGIAYKWVTGATSLQAQVLGYLTVLPLDPQNASTPYTYGAQDNNSATLNQPAKFFLSAKLEQANASLLTPLNAISFPVITSATAQTAGSYRIIKSDDSAAVAGTVTCGTTPQVYCAQS